MSPIQIAEGIIFVVMLTMTVTCKYESNQIAADNSRLQVRLLSAKANSEVLSNALLENNAIIEAQRLKIKNFKPVTVTEVVTEYIPKYVNVERGDCNDTKNMLDVIRTIDINNI